MTIRGTSIFGASDPFALTRTWMDEATPKELADPNAMALATVDSEGMPNVRIVLLKEIEDNAFVFYTNYDSTKGQELAATGVAALVLHWKSLARQVRVRGTVEKEDGAQADAYYASRALDSRLGAWASKQSRPLDTRQTLIDAVETARAEQGETPARPPHWGGFRIRPVSFEFWADGAFRLHDRERWLRSDAETNYSSAETNWSVERLYP